MRRANVRSIFLSFLLVAVCSLTSASKLRGTRTRRANQDSLLFIEGRKGGGKNNQDASGWDSGDGGSYDPEVAPSADGGGQKQKGETIYDRPPMKFAKEGENEQTNSKQSSKMTSEKTSGGTKEQGSSSNTKGGSTNSKDKVDMPVNSYDDAPTPPHEASEPPREKGSAKGESRGEKDEVAYDESYSKSLHTSESIPVQYSYSSMQFCFS